MNEEEKKPKDRAKKRKPVSKRTQLKRRQEFDIRALGKGEADETVKDVNVQWTRYYQELWGEEEAVAVQRGLIAESSTFLFTVFWGLGFPPLPYGMRKLLTVVEEGSERFSTFSIPSKDLTQDHKLFLERESRLGRCTLKRSRAVVDAIKSLGVQEGSAVLDILADEESNELCQRTDELVVLQRKVVPCFDSPTAVWQSAWTSSPVMQFDRILCRVPNSQDGQMHTRKEWLNWKTSNAKELSVLQLKIALELATKFLTVGGRMVYLTSSINPLENQDVVRDLVACCQGGLRVVEQTHTPVSEPGGGGYYCVLEKLGDIQVDGLLPFHDAAKLMQANDCLSALKNSSCLGTSVAIARHRAPKIAEGPFMVEPNVGLMQDLKLDEHRYDCLTSVQGKESYLCSAAVANYYGLTVERDGGEQPLVRRCGLLLLVEPDAPLEQHALVHVKQGLNVIQVQGEPLASQSLRSALKTRTVPFDSLGVVSDKDENYYVLELSYSDSDTGRQQHQVGERISTAQRKRMKRDAGKMVAVPQTTTTSARRTCLLFGRVIFDEEDNKLVEISNNEDWLESCAHSMFSSL